MRTHSEVTTATVVMVAVLVASAFLLGAFLPGVSIPEDPNIWQAYAAMASVLVAVAGLALLWRYVVDTYRLANVGLADLQATVRSDLARLNIELNNSLLLNMNTLQKLNRAPDDGEALPFTTEEHQLAGMLLNYLELVWQQKEVFGDRAIREWLPFNEWLKLLLQMPCVELYWKQAKTVYADGFRDHVHGMRPDLR